MPNPTDPKPATPTVVPMPTPYAVTAAMVTHFARRGLTQAEVTQLKLTLVDAAQMEGELGFKVYPRVQADRIPFFDIDGSELLTDNKQHAVRFRRNLPREGSQDRKYLSKKDSGSFAYLPQLDSIDWPTIAANPDEPLVITEGEYKAARACKEGITTVGLGGVWNTKGRHGLVTPLHKFAWDGRTVCVVFDADTESTPDKPFKSGVEKALTQFCAMLEARKATVFVLFIAKTKTFKAGAKMGLDDYLNAGGTWDELFATRASPQMEPQLAAMFERYAVAKTTKAHVLDLSTGNQYAPSEFTSIVESNKWRKNHDTGKMVRVAQDFLNHPERPEFDRYAFDPNSDGGLDQERRVFNHWPGIPVQPKHDAEHEATYVRFMQKMCGQHFDYIVNWFAHIFCMKRT
jgi:Domain of unknown function (DUF3854)